MIFYDQLLQDENLSLQDRNQVYFSQAILYEKLEMQTQAMDLYYQVVNLDKENGELEPLQDWYWYENAGFRLIYLLEQQQRWKAASRVAEKLISLKGPRWNEANQILYRLRTES